MDAMTLLNDARAAGLAVAVLGDKLVVRGPRRAEPVAKELLAHKRAVMAALAQPATSESARRAEWRARHREALAFWRAFHPADEALILAWGEVQDRWHKLHGQRTPPSICAGCHKAIGDGKALTLGDGAAVHFATLDCLISYGKWWRGEASAALVALGLAPPTDEERAA